jgi:hypothetical protein
VQRQALSFYMIAAHMSGKVSAGRSVNVIWRMVTACDQLRRALTFYTIVAHISGKVCHMQVLADSQEG